MWKSPREQVLVRERSPRHQSYTWISHLDPGCSVSAIPVDTKWLRDEPTQPSPSTFLKHKILIKLHGLGGIFLMQKQTSGQTVLLTSLPPCLCFHLTVLVPTFCRHELFHSPLRLCLLRSEQHWPWLDFVFFSVHDFLGGVTQQILSPSDTASTGVWCET